MPGRKTAVAWRIAMALCAAVAPAAARAGCEGGDIATEAARPAAIRPGPPRVPVLGCPAARTDCRTRAFLTPGAVVLAGPVQGAYTCAGFGGEARTGWVPTAALRPLPDPPPAPADWAGRWVAPERRLVLSAGPDGSVEVRGNASWGDAPGRRRQGAVFTGEIAGQAQPRHGVLAFTMDLNGQTLPYAEGDPGDCRIRLWRRGPYLLARDNTACGGHNVTFSGFYRRQETVER